ncbi:receptor-like serine/threonine-protein kinase SD1-8 [Iris pallida]|uniref:Receptor-like serine/threonine-protein kinase n=1 Tax=Iris pallida TaxID=29817 RepID=A0AAX6FGW3_IRIPA|nr:receptor-like serine/threonine-protein kinase SD1-8 [Iris pallida]KAJ6842387.1 receptor-like serine/threonine-protein kinase SD1-8 [Iris pallida]
MKLLHSRSFFFVLLLTSSFAPSIARDTITPTQPLADNQTLISSGGQFAFGFFTPDNSKRRYVGIWFNNMPDQKIVWVANRGSPVINSTGLLSVTANGTMMITDTKSTIVWSISATSGSNVSFAQLLDDGNLVLKQDDINTQRYAWQSFDHPTDTLLPGMKLGLDRITGLSRNLTSWKTETDPSEGEYYLVNTDINLDLYSRSGKKIWRSAQWDGIDSRSKGLVYSKVNDSQEVSFVFQASEQPTIFVVSWFGKDQWFTWQSDSRQWDKVWEEPGDQCALYGHCGANGICDITTTPICECLHGFVPKNPDKWASTDWTDGCIRKTELDCWNGTDGFVQISGAKLPDSPISFTGSDLSFSDCRRMCLNNCSCTAYAMYPVEVGCMIWMDDRLLDVVHKDGFQQDLYIRTAYADLVQSQKSKVKMVAILAPLLSGLVLLITCVTYFLQKRKRRRKGMRNGGTNFSNAKSNESNEDINIPLFEFGTIEAATDYFRAENALGQGGFGTVYKGKLGNNQEIAVKRLGRTSLQGIDEFKNEVMVIAKLQHRNLVRLLGCCIHAEERILIYEYMPNKSLDFFLFDKEKGVILDWRTRYQIVLGITRGLLYLHHDSRFRIIHRDLKASNILLDKTMNPKISDFGMARLFGGDDTDFKTRKVVGTYGYMSPEYAMGGFFSLKSDVYSYGVLILEIITGKKNSGVYPFPPYINLVAHAWNLWKEGKALELVDESMSKSFSEVEVLRCIKVGLLCVQELPADRPLMSSVMVMLGADLTSLPEPTQPGFIKTKFSFELDQNSSKQDSQVSNDLTITLDAR